VAAEQYKHQWSNYGGVYNACDHIIRQRDEVRCGGEQCKGQRNKQRRNAHGERGGRSADDYNPTGQPNCDGGTSSDLHSGGDGHCTVDLSMAKEWFCNFRGDCFDIHNSSNNDR
jgi:hypothetical protein